MQARLENWINGLNGDWCISRQRFFGVPFPIWYPVLADGSRDYAHPIAPSEDRLPIDPSTDVPDGYRPDQRDQPGGFSGRSRCDGHVGHVVVEPADCRQVGGRPGPLRAGLSDGRPSAGARHHQDVAVLDRAAIASGAQLPAVAARGDLRLGARPRPEEDVEVQRQRRHADGASRGTRIGRRALLGGQRTAWQRHRVRHGADARWPASRHQTAQRVEVRARRPRTRRIDILAWRRERGSRSRLAGDGGPACRRGHRRSGGLQLRSRPGAHRVVVLVLLRQLPGAREGPPLRRSGS